MRLTFLIGPHEAGLFLLLPTGPAGVTGHQVHVRPVIQQELHQTDVAMKTGTVQTYRVRVIRVKGQYQTLYIQEIHPNQSEHPY